MINVEMAEIEMTKIELTKTEMVDVGMTSLNVQVDRCWNCEHNLMNVEQIYFRKTFGSIASSDFVDSLPLPQSCTQAMPYYEAFSFYCIMQARCRLCQFSLTDDDVVVTGTWSVHSRTTFY